MSECDGKRRHDDQLSAIGAAIRCSARRGVALRAYACPRCGGWQLTSRPTPPAKVGSVAR